MEDLRQLVARILGMEPGDVSPDTSPDNVAAWDSFNGLMLASELEANFNVKFTMEEVTSISKVKDIQDCLKKHGVDAPL